MDKGKTILILGAGIYQVPLILEAKSRGMRTVVASIPGNYPGFALADAVYYSDTTAKEEILDISMREKIDAIATTGTDVAVSSISYVCSKLGLPGISENAAKLLTDKALMKEAFVKGNVNTAPFRRITSFDEAKSAAEELGLPVMLKIVDKSGSRGITKISDLSMLREAYDFASAATSADHMIVENFVEGKEIGIDGFVQNGKLLLFLPHDKYVYQSEHTGIPIGHYCPMQMSETLYKNMLHETQKIVQATGMDNCAINIDAFILPDESISIIEAAGRCGATGIPEVISGYTGRNYYSCIIDNALGNPVEPFDTENGKPTASILLYSKYSGIVKEIRYTVCGKEYINESCNIKNIARVDLSFFPGDDIDAFSNGTNRIGQAVFYADSNDELQYAVESFRHSLQVKVEPW